ncbi:hypothetical protein SAMN02745166_04531 [Prosthecobacter debontii]|uniref:Uncharacterized protein n=1 Tax=Prosthecobacter debontii TaxID=48467 RepID=A0A1T4YYA2_9BACT|nr:hypothetical protein [Prosthecobacter debontii]SKB06762.1 hypothetical protein SAMN02745166_04531 [Prosthecobacter debontii]
MSSETPPDDFSQLPTADGGLSSASEIQPQATRKQTRIGPRSSAALPQTPADESPESISSEWSDLIHHAQVTEPFTPAPSSQHQKADVPAETETLAPTPAPKRTVVGRRVSAPATDDIAQEAAISPHTAPASELSDLPLQTPSKPNSTAGAASQQLAESPSADPAAEGEKAAPSPAVAPTRSSAWRVRWERWGGRALTLSVIIHLLLIAGGATYVVKQVMTPKQVDFLPGGGSQQGQAASQALEHKIQQKKTPWLKKPMPMQKIGVANSVSDIVLPDDVPDLMNLPDSKDFLSSKLSGGMGLSGLGSGMNKAIGAGSQAGMVFQPFSLFGMQIKSKRLGLVLDVSTSMAPHLPRVIEEVDKVAKGSVVILYFGCGLTAPPSRGLDGEEVYSTAGREFEKFWRLGGVSLDEARRTSVDSKQPIPSEDIYRMLAKRSQTYFIHNVGLGYTWLALLNDKLRTADGIYWFSDFQDTVDFKQLMIVRENLLGRKQRLYMHAYERGPSFDLVKTQLVHPTQGDATVEE